MDGNAQKPASHGLCSGGRIRFFEKLLLPFDRILKLTSTILSVNENTSADFPDASSASRSYLAPSEKFPKQLHPRRHSVCPGIENRQTRPGPPNKCSRSSKPLPAGTAATPSQEGQPAALSLVQETASLAAGRKFPPQVFSLSRSTLAVFANAKQI
ncbi:hypothetical protein BDV29DRAFT_159153 [Aspergillus leporis]|uniref:Uncharacterized protein n=1 Tax=Aspergillus leporis TaxID=41062 RepID=A0A5N5WXB2_9EURO|nr:hypothetical protein BDV29DRAFT_159153 [Aspergillus leporis]